MSGSLLRIDNMALKEYEQRITITIEGNDYTETYSTTKIPITRLDAVDWFENQVLFALGYAKGEEE